MLQSDLETASDARAIRRMVGRAGRVADAGSAVRQEGKFPRPLPTDGSREAGWPPRSITATPEFLCASAFTGRTVLNSGRCAMVEPFAAERPSGQNRFQNL